MIEPSLNELLELVDCRYTLCVETAKRARQLMEGAECTVKCDSKKPISMAVNEIHQGKVIYTRLRESYK